MRIYWIEARSTSPLHRRWTSLDISRLNRWRNSGARSRTRSICDRSPWDLRVVETGMQVLHLKEAKLPWKHTEPLEREATFNYRPTRCFCGSRTLPPDISPLPFPPVIPLDISPYPFSPWVFPPVHIPSCHFPPCSNPPSHFPQANRAVGCCSNSVMLQPPDELVLLVDECDVLVPSESQLIDWYFASHDQESVVVPLLFLVLSS